MITCETDDNAPDNEDWPVSVEDAMRLRVDELSAQVKLLQGVWVPLDQTIGCAVCGWIDHGDSGTPHSEDCPIGFLQRRAEKAESQVRELRKLLSLSTGDGE